MARTAPLSETAGNADPALDPALDSALDSTSDSARDSGQVALRQRLEAPGPAANASGVAGTADAGGSEGSQAAVDPTAASALPRPPAMAAMAAMAPMAAAAAVPAMPVTPVIPVMAGALVHITVTAGERRADLGIPGGVVVAELVPELARELGQLSAARAAAGFRLVTQDGAPLEPDRSLVAQGVEHGAALFLQSAADEVQHKVYDDVVEAVGDLVESQFAPWTVESSARTALGASLVFFLAGAFALFSARGQGALVAAMAAAVCVLLLVASAVLAAGRQAVPAACLAVAAQGYAGVGGFASTTRGELWGTPLLYAGAAMVVAGTVGALVVRTRRIFVAAGGAVGFALAVIGALVGPAALAVDSVCAVVFAVAMVLANLVPWFALSASRLTTSPARSEAEIYAEPAAIDAGHVGRRLQIGHHVEIGLGVAAGTVAVLIAPALTHSGAPGFTLAATGFIAALLRTRHSRARSTVLVSMVSGIAGLAVTAVAATLQHPTWRPVIAVGLAAAAAVVVVAAALLLPRTRVRLARLGDAGEGVALIALFPLALWAAGLL